MRRTLLRLAPLCFALLLAGCEDGAAVCPESNLTCNGQCVDPQIDRNHCGGCDNVCNAGFQCIEGACACPAGAVACDGQCVFTNASSQHCGACGNACGDGESCVDGACVEGCAGIECPIEGGTQCITDADTNAQHCGACGNVCPAGTSCLGGACTVGDLYAACFGEGTIVPAVKATNTATNPKTTGIDGPQALALYGDAHLLALGSNDATLYVIDRATMDVVGSIVTGTAPNQVLVRGTKAYVIGTMDNTVQVISLADPAHPTTVDQVSTGAGTSPTVGTFDENGTLWVSLWLTNQVVPIDFAGATGVKGTPVVLDITGVEGTPYPAGVSVVNGTVYVALNNLDANFGPAGNGRLSTYEIATGAKGLVDLGPTCTNPGFTAADGTKIYVACTDSYFQGEVAVYDTAAGVVTNRIATAGGPSRISLDPSRPGWLYVSDAAGLGFFAVDPDGTSTKVDVCPAPTPPAFEFNADVVAAP